jgi:hypothetical protein
MAGWGLFFILMTISYLNFENGRIEDLDMLILKLLPFRGFSTHFYQSESGSNSWQFADEKSSG